MFGGKKYHHHHQNQRGEEEESRTGKGIDFFGGSNPKMGSSRSGGVLEEGYPMKPQELTLSYLCDKGKQVMVPSSSLEDQWVERDFLSLSETKSSSPPPPPPPPPSKRRESPPLGDEDDKGESFIRDRKKPKLESTLNLSLALPDVSATNLDVDPVVKSRPLGDDQTQMTCSNDFTVSYYSNSHAFSHNLSCSMTQNSDTFDCSVGRDDQVWCGGEGTNGSVHSRFRPVGDGVIAMNNGGVGGGGGGNGGFGSRQGGRVGKDSCNDSFYRTTSSDNVSFFPSELPAKPRVDTHSGDSRKRELENLRGFEGGDGGVGARKMSRPERILREIVSESIPVMAQVIQELPDETLESVKEYLRNVISVPEKQTELVGLQTRLERRSDLSREALSKCQKDQLEILVALKMGLGSFISGKVKLPTNELVEIFLFTRCRNVNCKSLLPVDDCDCKFCSKNEGFCSSCMCPVCMKFDSASNTCSWVGCDVCSHWCHAACGLQENLIRPGPSLKGPSGTSEMQFNCIGCDHASEMFGFIKDVFLCCAKDWGHETLIKELDCVKKIFEGSEDRKGKELHMRAADLLCKLENKTISSLDACRIVVQFFNYGGSYVEAPDVSLKGYKLTEASGLKVDRAPVLATIPLPPKYTVHHVSSSSGPRESVASDLQRNEFKAAVLGGQLKIEDKFAFEKMSVKDAYDSLESIVRIKEAEARMFQSKADDARREAESYRRMIQARSEKLEEEYADKLSKLCLQETEDRRRKKLEELKVLESSHCDYYNMKLRMQAEIAGLLKRMEATKPKLV